jgi:hypothetical protein
VKESTSRDRDEEKAQHKLKTPSVKVCTAAGGTSEQTKKKQVAVRANGCTLPID